MKKRREIILNTFLIVCLICGFSEAASGATDCFVPASNMVSYSDDMTSTNGWTKGSTTVTDDTSTTSPPENRYGVTKVFKHVLAAGQTIDTYGNSGSSYKYIVTGTIYKLSVYVKYSTARYLGFGITGGASYSCGFDLSAGTVGTCVGLYHPSITDVGNGWWYLEGYYSGNTAYHPISRLLFNNLSSSTYSAGLAATGGEIIYISSPQVQPVIDDLQEMKKYVPTSAYQRVFAPPRDCGPFQKNYVEAPSEIADNSAWTKTNATATGNTIATHDGLLIADTVTKNSASAVYGYARYTISSFLSTPDYVYYSAELKAGNVNYAFIGTWSENSVGLQIDLTTGAISHIGSSSYSSDLIGYHIEALGSSWYRVHLLGRHNFTAGSSTNIDVAPLPGLDNSMIGSGESGNYIYVARVRVAKDTDINPTLLEKIKRRKVHSATTTVITLDQGVKYADAWIGREICIDLRSANRLEECHCITSASAGSRTVTVSKAFTYTPAIGDIYEIGGTCESTVVKVESGTLNTALGVDTFTAIGGAVGYVRLPSSSYTNSNAIVRREVCITDGTGSGQCRCINSYDAGASNQYAYVAKNFDTAPASGSTVRVGGTCEASTVEMQASTLTASALATDAVTEIKDGTLGAAAEGTYAATTFGGYIEKIKKYVANKISFSGSAYTVEKDDGTTDYETGTSDATGRTPSN